MSDHLDFIGTNFLAAPTLSRTGGLVSVAQSLTLMPAAKVGSKLLYTLNGTDPRLPGGTIAPSAFSNSGSVTLQITNNIRVFAFLESHPPKSHWGSQSSNLQPNNLGNGGDHLLLEGPLGEPILDFTFSDTWYPATDGEGFSLVIINALGAPETWGVKTSWRPSGTLNGSPSAADSTPKIPGILINEALTHTDPPLLDTVELFNPTINQVALGGWFLTDDPHNPKQYRIPAGNSILPGGFITLTTAHFGVGQMPFPSIPPEITFISSPLTPIQISSATRKGLIWERHRIRFPLAAI